MVSATRFALSANIPLTVHEVPSGTKAFDWTVPREWTSATPTSRTSKAIESSISHQQPARRQLQRAGAQDDAARRAPAAPALATRSTGSDSVQDELLRGKLGLLSLALSAAALPDGDYEVVIDSTLSDGSLSYGECLLPGANEDEVLILIAHLPSVAGQRQPGGHRRMHVPRAAAGIGEAPLYLPVRLRSRDD